MTASSSPARSDAAAARDEADRLIAIDPAAAERALRAILVKDADDAAALHLLARALRALGRMVEAEQADLDAIDASARQPALAAAIGHLVAGRPAPAEKIVRTHLAARPDDAAALCLLADIADRVGIYADAEQLLRKVLAIAPHYADAKIKLANVLFKRNRAREAVALLEEIPEGGRGYLTAATARARILGQIGEYAHAAAAYEGLLRIEPDAAAFWIGYANVLKTLGRAQDAAAAYRRAIAIDPGQGVAWWSLSNMKTVRFGADEAARMTALLAREGGDDDARLHLHFALGKAHEDAGRHAESFRHYAAGNRLRLRAVPHDRAFLTAQVDRTIALFDRRFLAARGGAGAAAPDPIFILGMPRAGSTLIEQILSSHSAIEGTSELPDIPLLVHQVVAERWQDRDAAYPEALAGLDPAALTALGERYLAAARQHRKTGRPYFTDKLPNNWLYAGFIRLILPNAKIIDARRDAMACCFSNFKQHFARGQSFAYSLEDMGRYYRDYARLMAHFEDVMPGAIHRVQHEALVADPEREVRALLEYLGLPFEEACLRSHENPRAVRTASSEQVRRPINADALDAWRPYAPWLGPLREALGPELAG